MVSTLTGILMLEMHHGAGLWKSASCRTVYVSIPCSLSSISLMLYQHFEISQLPAFYQQHHDCIVFGQSSMHLFVSTAQLEECTHVFLCHLTTCLAFQFCY